MSKKLDMDVLSTLQAMRCLLDDPKHWTQGTKARDSCGQARDSRSGDAKCWCLLGAFEAVGGPPKEGFRRGQEREAGVADFILGKAAGSDLLPVFGKAAGSALLPVLNDTRSYRQVLVSLDHAIDAAAEKIDGVAE